MVPSVFLRWSEHYQQKILNNKNLKILALGGESFPINQLEISKHSNLKLYNLYGITEISCWATIHEVKINNVEEETPLGEVLEDTLLELRDENGKALENGIGEIFIGEDYITIKS